MVHLLLGPWAWSFNRSRNYSIARLHNIFTELGLRSITAAVSLTDRLSK